MLRSPRAARASRRTSAADVAPLALSAHGSRRAAARPLLTHPGRGSCGHRAGLRELHARLSRSDRSASLAAPAAAQDASTFPSRPIRIIVPFPAGGPTDINARIIAQKMSEDFQQPVVIENRPGGNTAIGAQAVAKAEPDGYTLLAAMDTTLVMNPATATAPLSYDPFRDFATITLTAKNTSLLTVRAADGPKSVHELIARAKQNPGKLNYGAGIITTRLAGYLFAREAGIAVQLIPYKGSADVVQGLLTGSVDFIVDGVAASLPLIQGGKLRPLAKLNSRPLPVLPDLQPLGAGGRAAAARGHVVVDRPGRAGRHAGTDRRQDRPRGRRDLRRSGRRRAAGEGRHHRHDLDAGRVRRVLPRRGEAVDRRVQGERDQAGVGQSSGCEAARSVWRTKPNPPCTRDFIAWARRTSRAIRKLRPPLPTLRIINSLRINR